MSAKSPPVVFLGYTFKVREGSGLPEPAFEAPGNFKDPDKIAAAIAAKRQAFLADAAGCPYYGEVEDVFLADPTYARIETFRRANRPAGGAKKPLAQAVAEWILKRYPASSFGVPLVGRRQDAPVLFLGFEPRRFFKLLGIECSMLPPTAPRLPPSLWMGAADLYRDIGELASPSGFAARPSWPDLVKAHGIKVEGWMGPHKDPTADANVACALAIRLGLFSGGAGTAKDAGE